MTHVTIYHLFDRGTTRDDAVRDVYNALWAEDHALTARLFGRFYRPAETILDCDDLNEAYHRAQGEVVNRNQNARHGVHSAMPTDVFELVSDDGTREAYMVARIGFTELPFDAAAVLGLVD